MGIYAKLAEIREFGERCPKIMRTDLMVAFYEIV